MIEQDTYFLSSNPMVYMPGLTKWALRLQTGDFDDEFQDRLIRIGFFANSFPDVPCWVVTSLADGLFSTDEKEGVVVVRRTDKKEG